MASHKVRLVDVIWASDRFVAETQVGDRNAARLLRVILEVCLDVFIRMVADDLRRVLVCAYGAVAAKSPELTFYRTLCRCDRSRFYFRKA